MMRAMEHRFSLDITVEVSDKQAVIDAAKAEMRLRFGVDDEDWETTVMPAIAQHGLGQAFSILLLADEITGFLTKRLEQSVPGLEVRELSVDTI